MIDLRFGVTVKPRSQIKVNSGNKTCVGDVVADVSVFFAVADGCSEDWSRRLVLVSSRIGLVGRMPR